LKQLHVEGFEETKIGKKATVKEPHFISADVAGLQSKSFRNVASSKLLDGVAIQNCEPTVHRDVMGRKINVAEVCASQKVAEKENRMKMEFALGWKIVHIFFN
jgi:hypothetical protein